MPAHYFGCIDKESVTVAKTNMQLPDNRGSDGRWAHLVTHCHCQRDRPSERDGQIASVPPPLASGDIISQAFNSIQVMLSV